MRLQVDVVENSPHGSGADLRNDLLPDGFPRKVFAGPMRNVQTLRDRLEGRQFHNWGALEGENLPRTTTPLDRTKQPSQAVLFVLPAGAANRIAMALQASGDVLHRLATTGYQHSFRAANVESSGGLPSSHPLQCGQIPGSDFEAPRFSATHEKAPDQ